MRADRYYPGFKGLMKWGPEDVVQSGVPVESGNIWYVDGDKSSGGAGESWSDAFATIQAAVDACSSGDVIYIAARTITSGATDPISYEENITISNATQNISLIGVSRGRTQGGLPQLKDGSTTTQEILRIRASGCLIANLGFNGAGNTGGGILLDESASGYVSFGTTITGCHFKNCKGATATNGATGGAIMWTSNGGAWQTLISENRFYKNVADIVLKGTSSSKPQDVVIEKNHFSPVAANTDINIYGKGGSGFAYVSIDQNVFGQVPAVGSGSNAVYMDLTGSTGMLTRNMFGCITAEAETDVTFGASGSAALVPTTVHMAGNWGQSGATAAAADGAAGEVFRT
jgi:hypothetical protein